MLSITVYLLVLCLSGQPNYEKPNSTGSRLDHGVIA